jgi:hypothetical protein
MIFRVLLASSFAEMPTLGRFDYRTLDSGRHNKATCGPNDLSSDPG